MKKMTELDVSVVIPAHNEATNIGNLVTDILTLYSDIEVISNIHAGAGFRTDQPVAI